MNLFVVVCCFRCPGWPTCCAKSVPWIDFGDNGNLMQKKESRECYRVVGRGGYTDLSSRAGLGHGASGPWFLERGRGDPAPCARIAEADLINY